MKHEEQLLNGSQCPTHGTGNERQIRNLQNTRQFNIRNLN